MGFVVSREDMVAMVEVENMLRELLELFEVWELGEEKRMGELMEGPYYLFYKGRKEAYGHCANAVQVCRRRVPDWVPMFTQNGLVSR